MLPAVAVRRSAARLVARFVALGLLTSCVAPSAPEDRTGTVTVRLALDPEPLYVDPRGVVVQPVEVLLAVDAPELLTAADAGAADTPAGCQPPRCVLARDTTGGVVRLHPGTVAPWGTVVLGARTAYAVAVRVRRARDVTQELALPGASMTLRALTGQGGEAATQPFQTGLAPTTTIVLPLPVPVRADSGERTITVALDPGAWLSRLDGVAFWPLASLVGRVHAGTPAPPAQTFADSVTAGVVLGMRPSVR